MKILFVGLSNKPNTEPFDSKTNSGKVLDGVIGNLNHECFKRNLVNYAPLNECNKLRYPTKIEIDESLDGFMDYIDKLQPDLIISFGNIVSATLRKVDEIRGRVLYEKHPSYMYTYKRKYLDKYVEDIVMEINKYKAQM